MLCSTYPMAIKQAETLSRYYASPAWVSQLRNGSFLVTLNPSALAGTNILRAVSPNIIPKHTVSM